MHNLALLGYEPCPCRPFFGNIIPLHSIIANFFEGIFRPEDQWMMNPNTDDYKLLRMNIKINGPLIYKECFGAP